MEAKQQTSEQPTDQRWIKREILKYFETSENGNILYQGFYDIAKEVVKGKFIAINIYMKKKKKKYLK
jgi:hypothetical protein